MLYSGTDIVSCVYVNILSQYFVVYSPPPCISLALVSESYDCHPGFTLPQDSYTLSLTKTPPQPKEFQALIDDLHTTLKQNSSQSIPTIIYIVQFSVS